MPRSQVAVAIEHPRRRFSSGEAVPGKLDLSTEPGDDRRSDTSPGGRSSVQRRTGAGRATGVNQQTDRGSGCDHVEQMLDDEQHDDVLVDGGEAAATPGRVPSVSQATTTGPAATRRDRGEAFVIERRVAISKLNASSPRRTRLRSRVTNNFSRQIR